MWRLFRYYLKKTFVEYSFSFQKINENYNSKIYHVVITNPKTNKKVELNFSIPNDCNKEMFDALLSSLKEDIKNLFFEIKKRRKN